MRSQGVHLEARQLIAERILDTLADGKTVWLEEHLSGCPECAAYADAIRRSVGILRTTTELPEAALVRATERAASRYALRLRERESANRMIVLSCFMAALWGAMVQPYVWRLFAWLGTAIDLPVPVSQTAFVMTWVFPGIVGALLLIGRRNPPEWKGAAHDEE